MAGTEGSLNQACARAASFAIEWVTRGLSVQQGQICLIKRRGPDSLVTCSSSHRLIVVEGALLAQLGLGRLGLDLALFLCAVAKW